MDKQLGLYHLNMIYIYNPPALPCGRNYLNLITQVGTVIKTSGFPLKRACTPSSGPVPIQISVGSKHCRPSLARQGDQMFRSSICYYIEGENKSQ